MIELCTKKRMAVAIVILISVSVITVVVESKWSSRHAVNKQSELSAVGVAASDNASMCWNGAGTIVESCVECNKFELKLEYKFCQESGFKTVIRCPSGRFIYKSCPTDIWKEEKRFLMFECITALTGLFSYAVVRYRQRRLDLLLMEKINRQIAAGL
ncbi:uncharacterized protein LOC115218136 [Argonauta hians]